MKFISWSVNGLKSAINHGFVEDFKRQDADFFCLQCTRLDKGEEPIQIPDYGGLQNEVSHPVGGK